VTSTFLEKADLEELEATETFRYTAATTLRTLALESEPAFFLAVLSVIFFAGIPQIYTLFLKKWL
jgi:hypothetical protein